MKKVTKFETADAKVWDSEQAAYRHERDLLCQRINLFLNKYFKTGHAPTTFDVVNIIDADRENFSWYVYQILSVLEHTDLK